MKASALRAVCMATNLIPALVVTAAMPVPAKAADPVVIKFASFTSPTGGMNAKVIPEFIRKVEEASEGTIKFEFYPGGTLGGNPAIQLKLVEDGVADIAQVVASYTPGRFPELGVFELPFLAETNVEGSLAAWRLYKKGHISGLDKFVMIGFLESGPYGLHGNFPIKTLADVKGKKIRAAGPVHGAIVDALGGVPVGNITAPQIAESISRRLLDGTLMSVASLFNFRIADTTFYHLNQIPMGQVSVMFPMNRAKYESLPPKAKAALDKYSGEWFTQAAGATQDEEEAESIAQLKADSKHHIQTLSADELKRWEAALAVVKKDWDKPNAKGVNLYQAMTATLSDLRSNK